MTQKIYASIPARRSGGWTETCSACVEKFPLAEFDMDAIRVAPVVENGVKRWATVCCSAPPMAMPVAARTEG